MSYLLLLSMLAVVAAIVEVVLVHFITVKVENDDVKAVHVTDVVVPLDVAVGDVVAFDAVDVVGVAVTDVNSVFMVFNICLKLNLLML